MTTSAKLLFAAPSRMTSIVSGAPAIAHVLDIGPALDSPPLPPSQATAQAVRRGSILAESRRRCQTSGRAEPSRPAADRRHPGKPAACCPISTAKKKSHPWRQHLGPNSAVSQRPASMIGTRFSRSAAHRPTSPGRQRPVSAPNRPTPKRCSEPVPTDDFEGFSVSARQHDQLEAREPTQRRVDCAS